MHTGMGLSDSLSMLAIVAILESLWIHSRAVIVMRMAFKTRRRTHHDYADDLGEIATRHLAGV
jgi:hypothetical protein